MNNPYEIIEKRKLIIDTIMKTSPLYDVCRNVTPISLTRIIFQSFHFVHIFIECAEFKMLNHFTLFTLGVSSSFPVFVFVCECVRPIPVRYFVYTPIICVSLFYVQIGCLLLFVCFHFIRIGVVNGCVYVCARVQARTLSSNMTKWKHCINSDEQDPLAMVQISFTQLYLQQQLVKQR